MSWFERLLRKITRAAGGVELATMRRGESDQETEHSPQAPGRVNTTSEIEDADATDRWAGKDTM